jgi:uncharacterized membrane protein
MHDHNRLGRNLVCTIVVVGFVMVLALFIVRPLTLSEQVLTLLNIMIGTLAAKFGDVVQFFIGSSAGSKNKDGVIETLSK